MNKSYIWSIPTRAFHWLFVLFIILAFITADEDRLLTYHAVIGYSVLILLFFRLVWGYIGPKHSRFKDFPLGISHVKEFLFNIFKKVVPHIRLSGVIGSVGKFKQGLDFSGQQELIEKAFSIKDKKERSNLISEAEEKCKSLFENDENYSKLDTSLQLKSLVKFHFY